MKILFGLLYIILWGFLICIGFWLGKKFTEGFVDKKIAERRANKIAQQTIKQGVKEGVF